MIFFAGASQTSREGCGYSGLSPSTMCIAASSAEAPALSMPTSVGPVLGVLVLVRPLVGSDQPACAHAADPAVVETLVLLGKLRLALRLGVRVLLRLLLRDAHVEGLAELLLERRVAPTLRDGPLLGRGVPLLERVVESAVVAEAVAVTLRLVLVVDAVAAVDLRRSRSCLRA